MRVIRKIFITLFLMLAFLPLLTIKKATKATLVTTDKLTLAGASAKTTGNSGIRFVGVIDNSFDLATASKVGIIVGLGDVAVEDLFVGATPNGKALGQYEANPGDIDMFDYNADSIDDKCVLLTIYNIPSESYGQKMTARMYAKLLDESYVYSESVETRSLSTVCSLAYNGSDTYISSDNLVKDVAESLKVKLDHNGGTRSYYYDDFTTEFNDALAANDTVTLKSGTYNEQLTMNKSGLKVYGPNKDKAINNDGTRTGGVSEAILTKRISLSANNLVLNGIKLAGTDTYAGLYNERSNVRVLYNVFEISTNNDGIIKSTGTSLDTRNLREIVISNNYFNTTCSGDYCVDINLLGIANNVTISNNYFKDSKTIMHYLDKSICIKKIGAGKYIDISNNTFDKMGASYIIDLNGGHSTSNRTSGYINIQSNDFVADGTSYLNGNAIRALYLGTGTIVNIVDNRNIRTNSYYNAILLSTNTSANSAVDGITPGVNLLYNHLYAILPGEAPLLINESNGTNDGVTTRSAADKAMSRIGIGIKDGTINSDKNYKSSNDFTISKYAYLSLNNESAGAGTWSISGTTTNKGNVDTALATYESDLADFITYIATYTSGDIDAKYSATLSYSADKFTYTGTDAAYMIAVIRQNG